MKQNILKSSTLINKQAEINLVGEDASCIGLSTSRSTDLTSCDSEPAHVAHHYVKLNHSILTRINIKGQKLAKAGILTNILSDQKVVRILQQAISFSYAERVRKTATYYF